MKKQRTLTGEVKGTIRLTRELPEDIDEWWATVCCNLQGICEEAENQFGAELDLELNWIKEVGEDGS